MNAFSSLQCSIMLIMDPCSLGRIGKEMDLLQKSLTKHLLMLSGFFLFPFPKWSSFRQRLLITALWSSSLATLFVLPLKPFKFFNFWTRHPNFLQVVKTSWELIVDGLPMMVLQKKLKRLKGCLRAFNQLKFADITLKVKEKSKEYEAVQLSNLTSQPSIAQIEKERTLA